MYDARFFKSTRGKIVASLRRRRSATAVELAAEFGLSPNAVRQHLLFLERDGYVVERSVRRGPTKPTHEYSLTDAAAGLFPQRYDKMLGAVLSAVRDELGSEAIDAVFAKLGEQTGERFVRRVGDKTGRARLEAIAELLREQGVEADVIDGPGGLELREHNCPYSQTVGDHPELCSVIHTALGKAVPGETRHVESLATGGEACRFQFSLIESVETSVV